MLQLKNIVKDYGEGDSKVQALKGVSINFGQMNLFRFLDIPVVERQHS